MTVDVNAIINNLIQIGCFALGVWVAKSSKPSKLQEDEKEFRQFYHKCKYCKHRCFRGKSESGRQKDDYVYCYHPDNNFSTIYKLDDNGFCGKWELAESMLPNIQKWHAEKALQKSTQSEKPVESSKRGLKN